MNILFRCALNKDYAQLLNLFKKSNRDTSICELYFEWKNTKQCKILLALNTDQEILGQAIILWQSRFKLHANQNIPEMMDLYIDPTYRRIGIATKLLTQSEAFVKKTNLNKLGLGVLDTFENAHLHTFYTNAHYQRIGFDMLQEGRIHVYEKRL